MTSTKHHQSSDLLHTKFSRIWSNQTLTWPNFPNTSFSTSWPKQLPSHLDTRNLNNSSNQHQENELQQTTPQTPSSLKRNKTGNGTTNLVNFKLWDGFWFIFIFSGTNTCLLKKILLAFHFNSALKRTIFPPTFISWIFWWPWEGPYLHIYMGLFTAFFLRFTPNDVQPSHDHSSGRHQVQPTQQATDDPGWGPCWQNPHHPRHGSPPMAPDAPLDNSTRFQQNKRSTHRRQQNPFISYESRPQNLSQTNEENNINDATQFASNRTNNPLVFIASGHKLPPHPSIFFSQFFAHIKHRQPKISSKPKNINTHTHHTRFHHNIYYIYIGEWLQISLLFALNSILFQI